MYYVRHTYTGEADGAWRIRDMEMPPDIQAAFDTSPISLAAVRISFHDGSTIEYRKDLPANDEPTADDLYRMQILEHIHVEGE